MTKEFKMKPYPVLTDKDHEYIIRVSKQGYGFFEIASNLNISVHKLSKMRELDKSLDETLNMAYTHSGGWWEALIRENTSNNEFTNTTLCIARMNNCYGWGSTPSQRTNPLSVVPKWEGSIEQKVDYLDYLLREKKIPVEVYEHLMKALEYHCKINEICYIKPQLERMEIERKFSAGEIKKAQYAKEIELWEEAKRVREVAAERIMKRDKVMKGRKKPTNNKSDKIKKV